MKAERLTLPGTIGNADDMDEDSGGRVIRAGMMAILLFFVGLGGWAALMPLDAGVVAPGLVTVAGHRQTVQHPDGGVVVGLYVREGQRVHAGDVLIDLDRRDLAANEQSLMGELINNEALASRLRAEILSEPGIPTPSTWAALPPRYAAMERAAMAQQNRERTVRQRALGADLSVLSSQRGQYQQRIGSLAAQVAAVDEQIRSVQAELSGLVGLTEKGYVSKTRLRQMERLVSSLQAERAQLRSAQADASSQTGTTGLQAQSMEGTRLKDVANQLREIETAISDLRPRAMAARERLEKASIRAPVDGTIVGLSVFTVGGVIGVGERLMDIVPTAQKLVLEVQLEPRDADDVNIGMATEVRFLASSSRTLPIFHGTVSRLSADRLTDEKTGKPYFKGEVTIAPGEVAKLKQLNAERVFGVGLPVEVIIPLQRRTALQFLLDPLTQRLWGSFREH